MTDFYIRKRHELGDYEIDTNIIANKRVVKFISGVKYEEDIEEIPVALKWYPRCNSYYAHTEDVDALNRVHQLLASKQYLKSFTHLEAEEDVASDAYDEDEAQTEFLKSKPATFLILGKPGIGERNLGRLLAEHWKCVYIDPEILVSEEIQSGSRAGQCIEFNLRCGRAISADVILRLLEKRVRSKSAQHRGFVICEFPLIRNDMYQEDPVSSESAVFTVQEIFEDIVEPILTSPESIRRVSESSILSREVIREDDGTPEEQNDEQMEQIELKSKVKQMPRPDISPSNPIDVGSATSNICKSGTIGRDYSEQLMFIFSLCHKPLVIIYIMCQNTDVITKHENYRYNLNTREVVDLLSDQGDNMVYTIYTRSPGFDNDQLPDNFLGDLEQPKSELRSDRSYLTYVPSDFSWNVATQLEHYHYEALPTIEKRVLLHDPQYFIKVDGRISPYRMYNIVKTKLRILPIPHVIVPEILLDAVVPTGGEGDTAVDLNKAILGKTPQDCFDDLSQKKIINRMFKWKWSKWGSFCPVAMKNGRYLQGKPNYAVKFMNRIFFLSSEEALVNFTRNPRSYLLPPAPKHSCKIFIIGPRASGKTAVAKCLSLLLNGTVLNPVLLREEYFQRKRKLFLDEVRTQAINEALTLLEDKRLNEYEELEAERKLNGTRMLESQLELIEKRIALFKLMTPKETAEVDPDPISQNKDEYDILQQDFIDFGLPFFSDIDLCMDLSVDPEKLSDYLPDNLKNPTPPLPAVNIFDVFVTEYADKTVDAVSYQSVEMTAEDTSEMYISAIKETEETYKEEGESHGGWIVDGVPPDYELLKVLIEKCKPDDIFLLRDAEKTFLLDRFKIVGRNEFRDYRKFFEMLGKPEIAAKSPSVTSTRSCKARLARDVIENVLDDVDSEGGDEYENDDEFVEVDYFASHPTRVALKKYEIELDQFQGRCDDLLIHFEENGVPFVDVNVAGKSLPQLMIDVVKHINARFCIEAHRFTPVERLRELQDFGGQEILGEDVEEEEEDEEGGTNVAGSFNENRRLGNFSYYCPVTFHDHWVLWKGKEEHAAKYDDKLYFLRSEEALGIFIKNPLDYLDDKPPASIPPPRICVVGVGGSGKTTLAKYLGRTLGLYYVSYEALLKKLFRPPNDLDLNSLIFRHKVSAEATQLEEYLMLDQPLPEEFMEKICLKKLWYDEPFKSGGFVLDDYPKRPCDIDYMKRHALIPDIILELSGTNIEVNRRRIQLLINEWTEKINKEHEEQNKIDKRIADKWEKQRGLRITELLDIKKQERFRTRIQERGMISDSEENEEGEGGMESPSSDRSQLSYDSVAEEADLDDVLKAVALEHPEPVFEDIWETVEEATERIIEQTENSYVDDIRFYDLLKELCDAELIEWVIITVDSSPEKVRSKALRSVDKIKFRNESFFERCYAVTVETAEKLLEAGCYFLSRFGRVCPVQLYEKVDPWPMFYPSEERLDLHPVLYRSCVYFLAGKVNREKFCSDPLKYTSQRNDPFPLVALKVAVIGPPKCGKTALAVRFKNEMGLKYVSIGQAARYVLRFLPYSILAKRMEEVLRNGWELTSEMTMRCVAAMAFDGKSITQGIVFDGFPNSKDDVRHLEQLGLVPNLIIDLEATTDDIYKCLASDTGKRGLPTFSRKFIDRRCDEWSQHSEKFRLWLERQYQIAVKLPIKKCKWSIWKSAYDLATSVLSEIKRYHKDCNNHTGLRLANMQVSPAEFLERESSFRHYCPCCLNHKNLLVTSGEPPNRTGLVQFHRNYYWLCADHIDEFIKNPEACLPPYKETKLPEDLPVRDSYAEKPQVCYENGICIVCFMDNYPERVFNEGRPGLACLYSGSVYLFDTENCVEKFLSEPWKYSNKPIKFKPAIPSKYFESDDLPVLGLLEQYVAQNVVKAVTNTSIMRPVLPGLSITQSAVLNIGLYLKANNPNTPKEARRGITEATRLFNDRRLFLIDNLAKLKRTVNPYLYYEEPPLESVDEGSSVGGKFSAGVAIVQKDI